MAVKTLHLAPCFAPRSFHYTKPQAESEAQFEADVKFACSSVDYKDFKVTKTEPGSSSEQEGFVAFSYK